MHHCNIFNLQVHTGPSLPAAPVVVVPVTSPTFAVIQWSVPVVTYSPEQYTVYYTTNSSGCPTNTDEGYNKSVTVYGLNHTDFFTIRDHQYNVTLNNVLSGAVYCYKVVATNTEGRNESETRQFVTTESGMCSDFIQITYKCITYTLVAPSGPPQEFIIISTSHNLTLSWSPPLPSQRNGVIISYFVLCSIGGVTSSVNVSGTSLVVLINPFTNYTCTVQAATMVGHGPPVAVSGVSNEDGEFLDHSVVTMISFMMCCTVPAGPPRQVFTISETSTVISLHWSSPSTPNGLITEYQLQCSGGGQVFIRTVMETITTLSGLLPYTNYSCSITAHTSAGGGPAATASVTTLQDGDSIKKYLLEN